MWKIAVLVNGKRGKHQRVFFGKHQQRGGNGLYYSTPHQQTKLGQNFIKRNKNLTDLVAAVIRLLDPEFARTARKVHLKKQHKLTFGKLLGYGVVNLTSPHKLHKDQKDWKWSASIVFGKFSGGGLYLPYLSVRLLCQPGDLVIINSYLLFHVVEEVSKRPRGSLILTSHTTMMTGKPRHTKKQVLYF